MLLTRSRMISNWINLVVLDQNVFLCVVLPFTGFYWVLLGFTGL